MLSNWFWTCQPFGLACLAQQTKSHEMSADELLTHLLSVEDSANPNPYPNPYPNPNPYPQSKP